MDGRIMVDVAEMLKAGFLDRDLFQCDAEGADEVASVSIGAVGRTEAGIVMPMICPRGIFRASNVMTVTSRARVESSPPEIPTTAV